MTNVLGWGRSTWSSAKWGEPVTVTYGWGRGTYSSSYWGKSDVPLGWGRAAWGASAWGSPPGISINVTGVVGTSSVGQVTNQFTGLSTTGVVGSGTTITGDSVVTIANVPHMDGQVGSISAGTITNVYVTGVSSTTAIGEVTNQLTGVSAAGQVGQTFEQIRGIEIYASSGTATVKGDSTTGTVTGSVGTGQVGSVQGKPLTPAAVTGVESTTGMASVIIVIGNCTVFPTGIEVIGETNSSIPSVWGEIIPAPGNTWNEIAA